MFDMFDRNTSMADLTRPTFQQSSQHWSRLVAQWPGSSTSFDHAVDLRICNSMSTIMKRYHLHFVQINVIYKSMLATTTKETLVALSVFINDHPRSAGTSWSCFLDMKTSHNGLLIKHSHHDSSNIALVMSINKWSDNTPLKWRLFLAPRNDSNRNLQHLIILLQNSISYSLTCRVFKSYNIILFMNKPRNSHDSYFWRGHTSDMWIRKCHFRGMQRSRLDAVLSLCVTSWESYKKTYLSHSWSILCRHCPRMVTRICVCSPWNWSDISLWMCLMRYHFQHHRNGLICWKNICLVWFAEFSCRNICKLGFCCGWRTNSEFTGVVPCEFDYCLLDGCTGFDFDKVFCSKLESCGDTDADLCKHESYHRMDGK